MIAPSEADETLRAYLASTPVSYSGGRRLVLRHPALDLVVVERHVEPPRRDVDRHLVALAQGGDRPTLHRLRRDVADHQPAGAAREAAVGDQRHLLAEPLADDRGGDLQHLAHPGAAGRALVADHDHVAGLGSPGP